MRPFGSWQVQPTRSFSFQGWWYLTLWCSMLCPHVRESPGESTQPCKSPAGVVNGAVSCALGIANEETCYIDFLESYVYSCYHFTCRLIHLSSALVAFLTLSNLVLSDCLEFLLFTIQWFLFFFPWSNTPYFSPLTGLMIEMFVRLRYITKNQTVKQ